MNSEGTWDPAIHARERALIVRLQRDDADAFATLMRDYADRLARFAAATVGSRDGAEDVVQHVFFQLWERRATLDPERSLKPYLFRAVRNRALDEARASLVRQRHGAAVTADADAARIPSPEGEILTSAAVHAALATLPERRRLALRLRLQEDMSHAEVAEVLGISAMAAQSLFVRALADLREKLRVPD